MSEAKTTTRVIVGKVISAKMQKSIVVQVERQVAHPLYGKYIRRSNRVVVHDESNDCREGDTVEVVSCRPLAKRKAWTLSRVLERAR